MRRIISTWVFVLLSAFLFVALSAGSATAVCGDSTIDPGEGCDPPDGVCCSTVCQCSVGTNGCGAVCMGILTCNYAGGPPSSCMCVANPTPPPLDHFTVYNAIGPPPAIAGVTLRDQFQTQTAPVGPVRFFLPPVDKNGEGIFDPDAHLTCYDIPPDALAFSATVRVTNQFSPAGNPATLSVFDPFALCLPTEKFPGPVPIPLNRDHYKCYGASGPPVGNFVILIDQFQFQTAQVLVPFALCNPVDKNAEGILNPFDHLVCYETFPPGFLVGPIPIRNQFGLQSIDVFEPFALCVPSTKEVL